MSNVLIGIIGVILFIGLALAGSLFLGPRFKEARLSSRAVAAVQMASQTAQAANLYRLSTGREAVSTDNLKEMLVDTGYLKSLPATVYLIDGAGLSETGQPAATVLYNLGADEDARSVCEAIERQMGREALDTSNRSFTTSRLRSDLGCKSNGAIYFAFAKL